MAVAACDDCRERVPVESVERLPYPSCGGGELPEGEVLASGHLRAGPTMRGDRRIVERFEIRRRGCLHVVTVRQEWPLGTADVEAVYDASLRPLRVWKRMVLPAADDPIAEADIRLYELRHDPPTLEWRTPEGDMEYRILKGPRPEALVGPGRGLLSVWIRRAGLKVGEKERVPVLDFRKEIETIEPVTLKRGPDRHDPSVGGEVRVYTVFGRETVFTDEDGVVVGDLRGMRPDALLDTPAPPPLPAVAPPDPRDTP
ncbi:MAG: hypothetical protein ACOC97_02200 [Myxococcota bacterium]